ncbi:MAG: hypothetical protein PHW64_07885 [Sulfuricurvum sp.]|nr:hypothetical protein [Sulfuricurvum sp.]
MIRAKLTAAALVAIVGLGNSAYGGVEVAACCDSRGYCGYKIGSSWEDTHNGERYHCQCTSGGGSCSASGSSGGIMGKSSSGGRLNENEMIKNQIIQGTLSEILRMGNAKPKGVSPDAGMSASDIAQLQQQQLRTQQASSAAFHQNKEKLQREMKGSSPLEGGLKKGTSAVTESSVRAQAKEETFKALKQLSCSAYRSLQSAKEASSMTPPASAAAEDSLSRAALSANESMQGPCPEVSMFIPENPPPIEKNPQVQGYAYLYQKTSGLRNTVIEKQKIGESIEAEKETIRLWEIMYNEISIHPETADSWIKKME